ncbi:hypothetical protein A9Q90_01930 [Gammaproteobacteria bacterium 54_18_T64]|nr:hypothetical protein A9Q90_01930 [Gammaproteobacteria bacterium 54_18_T64]
MNKLPTDNLYKFVALSGVTLAIASIYLFVSKVYEYKDNLLAHKDELEFLGPVTQTGAIIGLLLAGVGFYLWYIKLQKPADLELEEKVKIAQVQSQRDKEALRLNKYQTIYEELSKLEHQTNFTNFLMLGDLAYGRKFDPSQVPKSDRSTLKMHISFYAPSLERVYEGIEKLDSEFTRILSEFILKVDPTEEEKKEFIVGGTMTAKMIVKEIATLKIKLSEIVKNETSKA